MFDSENRTLDVYRIHPVKVLELISSVAFRMLIPALLTSIARPPYSSSIRWCTSCQLASSPTSKKDGISSFIVETLCSSALPAKGLCNSKTYALSATGNQSPFGFQFHSHTVGHPFRLPRSRPERMAGSFHVLNYLALAISSCTCLMRSLPILSSNCW